VKPASRKPASVQTRTFRAGEVIFREGDDPRDEAFLLHAGRVEIRKKVGDEDRLIRVFVKGELLGELGLFGGSPRSATAVAVEAVTLVVIPAKRLSSCSPPTNCSRPRAAGAARVRASSFGASDPTRRAACRRRG
jgi:CRP-like cAMP-binding protein